MEFILAVSGLSLFHVLVYSFDMGAPLRRCGFWVSAIA